MVWKNNFFLLILGFFFVSLKLLYLSSLDELLADAAISAAVAGGDEIGHAAALEEGRQLGAAVKRVHELDHLHQSKPDYGCFGVVTQAQSVDETGGTGDNIL